MEDEDEYEKVEEDEKEKYEVLTNETSNIVPMKNTYKVCKSTIKIEFT